MDEVYRYIVIIVLFLIEGLAQKINTNSRMYVYGALWQGRTACGIALANWQADPNRSIEVVKGVPIDLSADL